MGLRFIFGLLQKMLEKYFSAWKKCFVCLHKCFSAWNNNVFWHGRKMFLRFDKKIFFGIEQKRFCSIPKKICVKLKKHTYSILKNILVPSQKTFVSNRRNIFSMPKNIFPTFFVTNQK